MLCSHWPSTEIISNFGSCCCLRQVWEWTLDLQHYQKLTYAGELLRLVNFFDGITHVKQMEMWLWNSYTLISCLWYHLTKQMRTSKPYGPSTGTSFLTLQEGEKRSLLWNIELKILFEKVLLRLFLHRDEKPPNQQNQNNTMHTGFNKDSWGLWIFSPCDGCVSCFWR